MPSNIVQFLTGRGFDHKGRKLNQIRAMGDDKFESEHDFIQWMFPSDIPSKSFPDAPVLTDEDITEIKENDEIQIHLQLSVDRIKRFYGANDNWITKHNHNFLRLTRILRFLWLAGRTHDYVCIQKILDLIYIDYEEIIGDDTFRYWKNANDKDFLVSYKPTVSIPVANSKTNPYDASDEDLFNYR